MIQVWRIYQIGKELPRSSSGKRMAASSDHGFLSLPEPKARQLKRGFTKQDAVAPRCSFPTSAVTEAGAAAARNERCRQATSMLPMASQSRLKSVSPSKVVELYVARYMEENRSFICACLVLYSKHSKVRASSAVDSYHLI